LNPNQNSVFTRDRWAFALGTNEVTRPNLPTVFNSFNDVIGGPIHPNTGKPAPILDYQNEYFEAIMNKHKVILNKSRKIGATEIALRSIMYNILQGLYANHSVMIVAGNKQATANKFIKRMKQILTHSDKSASPLSFTDLNGRDWYYDDLVEYDTSSKMEFWNGCEVEAYPANDSTRGPENTICVFMSEAAFIDLLDDREVYNAVKPNIANIANADFILESTPNGRRGFFFDEFQAAKSNQNEYTWLEHPYTRAMGTLLNEQFIEDEKKNPKIDFDQEYNCKFTTSQAAAFSEEIIKYSDEENFHEY
jgi:hypothetical protein